LTLDKMAQPLFVWLIIQHAFLFFKPQPAPAFVPRAPVSPYPLPGCIFLFSDFCTPDGNRLPFQPDVMPFFQLQRNESLITMQAKVTSQFSESPHSAGG
jgi:hypothetical protein